MGYMALGRNIPITSLVSDGFSLIFVVFPNVFNIMDPWVYIVAPAFFLLLFVGSLSTILALIEPLTNSICEKFAWTRDRTIRQLVLVGLFVSFIFATGMGEYLLRIADSFITQFAIVLGVLLEIIVLGWVYDIEDIRSILNDNSHIKVDKSWVITIRFIIPIILAIIWIIGVYCLILAGDRQSLLVQSIIASIFVIVPLVLTILPYEGDYSLDLSRGGGVNYFKEKEYVDKTIDDYADEEENPNPLFDKNGSFVSPYKSLRNRFKKSEEEEDAIDDMVEEDNSKSRRLNRFGKSKSKSGKNVLKNVDMSSEEFDSPFDDDYDSKYNDAYGEGPSSKEPSQRDGKKKSKSLFDKINMFSKDKEDNDNLNDDFDEDLTFDDDYDDLDYIAPIREEDGSNNQRNHTFKSSRDAEVFDNLDDYVEKPKPKLKKSASKKPKAKAKAKSSSKKAKVEEPAEEDYEDFTDDFFDDGVFGDEGYESLLDDYEKPKSKSRKSSKRQSEEEYTVYDYERKGADSVFNLDDD
jgi:NSS family neurotransmitter:Na+ symporter